MDITIHPGKLCGTLNAIPSKSQAHRLLICAAFADNETRLICPETNQDIASTVECLNAIGASITKTDYGYHICPIREIPHTATLNCHESGSTLRFLLPIVGALGIDSHFLLEGRLPIRPLSPLWEEMERMGCRLCRPTDNTIHCCGQLKSGDYSIDGSVSSQYITGLLFALSQIPDSTLTVTGKVESRPYIDLTKNAMAMFSAPHYHTPGTVVVEGDWSNGAFWLTANALGSTIKINNLQPDSVQGDRAVAEILPILSENTPTISAADIPDLVPILSVAAACNHGAIFTDVQRLRLKESDRIASTIDLITALGGKAEVRSDVLRIYETGLIGGKVNSYHDHRIAMAAAIGATVCQKNVTILGAECVTKSYPAFWEDFKHLGGNYEQLLR